KKSWLGKLHRSRPRPGPAARAAGRPCVSYRGPPATISEVAGILSQHSLGSTRRCRGAIRAELEPCDLLWRFPHDAARSAPRPAGGRSTGGDARNVSRGANAGRRDAHSPQDARFYWFASVDDAKEKINARTPGVAGFGSRSTGSWARPRQRRRARRLP